MKKTNRSLFFFLLFFLLSSIGYGQALVPYEQLDRLYKKRDIKTLEQDCQKNLKAAPKGDEIYLETLFFLIAGRVYQGDYQSAVPYMKLFRDAHVARDMAESKKNGTTYILIDSRFTGLYYELGKYYFEMENWPETVDWLNRARSSSDLSQDPMLFFRLGTAYMSIKDYENSRKYLGKELELDPKEPSPYYNIACTYALEKNKGKALGWLEKAVKAHRGFGGQARKDADFEFLRGDPDFNKVTFGR